MDPRAIMLLCAAAAAVYGASKRRVARGQLAAPCHRLSDRTGLRLPSELGLPPVAYRRLFSSQRCLVCFADPKAPKRCELVECRVVKVDPSTGAPEIEVVGFPKRADYHGVTHGDAFRLRAPGKGSIEEDVGIFATMD